MVRRLFGWKAGDNLAALRASGFNLYSVVVKFNRFHIAGIVALLSIPCFAQTVGNLPTVRQANTGFDSNSACSHTANCVNFPEPVVSGNLLAGCISYASGSGGTPPSSVTDNVGTTYTVETGVVAGSGGNSQTILIYHGLAAASGTNWVIINGGGSYVGKTASEISGVSATDGSVVNGTGSGANPTGSVSTSATSTANNDIAINCTVTDAVSQPFSEVGNVQMGATDYANRGFALETFANMGTAGSQTFTNYIVHDNGSGHYAQQTLLFKPTPTIFLADTALPQAAGSSVVYSAQLHCIGGTASQTYAVATGTLPTGITLNTSTGVLSATNVTGSTQVVGFTCTDGTHTSATDTLTLTVGTSLITPSLGTSTSGGFGGGGGSLSALSVQCGDSILMCVSQADDTHGTSGWVQMLSGTGNYFKDSLGSTVQRFAALPGMHNGPNMCMTFGPVTTAGSDTISAANNQSAASGLNAWAVVVHNTQGVLDTPTWTNNVAQSSGSLSVNYTTTVPNTLLVTIATSYPNTGLGSPSITHSAPFTQQFLSSTSFTMQADATDAVASPSTVTATANYTVLDTNGSPESLMVVPLRPALTFTGCVSPTFLGEKYRRQMF